MIVVLNGPLGIGKSTLAEALVERVDECAMLDGDALVAVNPAAAELSAEENLKRIARRASTRAIDEVDFERRTVAEEREMLAVWTKGEVGTLFDVDAEPSELATRLIHQLGLRAAR